MYSTQTLAVVLAALTATSAFSLDCARSYIVQEGDTCDSISAANNVSTYQLAVTNNGHIDSACNNLNPGDSLCLGYVGEDCSTTYVVRENDTCDHIMVAHALNSTLLYLNNPQINEACDNIYIGEVLCVSQSVQVPPAPTGIPPAATIPATATPAISSATNTPTKIPVHIPLATTHTSTTIHTSAAIHASTATHTSAAIHTPVMIHSSATTHTSAAIHTSIPQSGGNDDDGDEDLPYCDEI